MADDSVKVGDLLWTPSDERIKRSMVSKYIHWLKENRGLAIGNYDELWQWSVTEIEDFWGSIWEYFEIKASKPYKSVLKNRTMPGAKWFEGSYLNYTDNIFKDHPADKTALIFRSEHIPYTEITWGELEHQVASVAYSLRKMGVTKGDRVAAFVPNIPETMVAFLATASIGAIWSCCSPDFGIRSVVDRFKQIKPKVLFAVDGYRYNGKPYPRLDAVDAIRKELSNRKNTILIPYLDTNVDDSSLEGSIMWNSILGNKATLNCEQVAFDHPLWIVYSSGTTGLPKPLVHSHGGCVIELVKLLGFHMDVNPGDRYFWFSTTGWIMWNILQGSLLCGGTAVLFDGSPLYPEADTLYEFAAEAKVDFLGSGAPLLAASMKAGLEPGKKYDLSRLRSVGSTGAPLLPEVFKWVYDSVKSDLWLTSVSGGTDITSGFVGGVPILPVHAGELQCRSLGVKVEAFDEAGNNLIAEVGELVVTEPMPSMPLYLWNDTDGSRYHDSYFDMYPGIWRHGDWIKFTSRGSCMIMGRSDSTLKRMGVRMGSSDFYGVVDAMPEVAESLIIGVDLPDGKYWMPMFVVPASGYTFDEQFQNLIKDRIKESMSPRHLPDCLLEIIEVPKTLNGKKLEVPVKKLLMGWDDKKAVNIDATMNPDALQFFIDLGRKITAEKNL